MAPIKKRVTTRAKVTRTGRPTPTTIHDVDSSSLFPNSKKDKQRIKHSSFVSKIEKSSSKTRKRRRPNKTLVTNLESLADALSGLEDDEGDGIQGGVNEVRRKSLKSMKSRPGALKRKEKIEKLERDRFNKNMAQLASSTNGSSVQDRWAALKSHVQSNMEIKPEFVKKDDT